MSNYLLRKIKVTGGCFKTYIRTPEKEISPVFFYLQRRSITLRHIGIVIIETMIETNAIDAPSL